MATFTAYGWPTGIGEEDLLTRLLKLNHERGAGAETPLVVLDEAEAKAKAAKPKSAKTKLNAKA